CDPTTEVEVKEETNRVEKRLPNFNKKVEALQEQLRLLFEHQKLEKESNQAKEIIVTNDPKNIQKSESKESIKPTMEKKKMDQKGSEIEIIVDKKATVGNHWDAEKSNKKLHFVGGQFVEKETMDEKKVERQNKAEEKYS